MQAPRRLQLRRGNTAAVSSYIGAAGEVTVNTTNWSLRVHDGSTPGGYTISSEVADLSGNITQLQNDVIGLTANAAAQSGQIATVTGNVRFNNGTIYHASGSSIRISPLGNGNPSWVFDPDGRVIMPGNLIIDSTTSGFDTVRIGGENIWVELRDTDSPAGFYVRTGNVSHEHYWTFDDTGNLIFPDTTVQSTAWTGFTANAANWSGSAPTTVNEAINRLAVLLKALNGGTGA